jgi:hypothetical protein
MESTEPGSAEVAAEHSLGADPTNVETETATAAATTKWQKTTFVAAGFVVLALVGEVIRCHLVGKPITFDVANYQYYTGYAEIHGYGSPLALPGGLETYLDPQLNTLYYLLIDYLPARIAVYSIAALQSLSVSALGILVWALARRLSPSSYVAILAGLVAAAGAYLAPIYAIETGETSSDALLALLLFAVAALLYHVLGSPVSRRAYVEAGVAGLVIGIDAELKFTQSAYGVALLAGFALALLVARRTSGRTLRQCAGLVAAVALPAGVLAAALYLPEAIFLWHRFRDPLFPFYNGVFHSADLKPGDYSPGYVARSPSSLWQHFSQLLVRGADGPNGFYEFQLRSTVLFFSLMVVFLALLFDLVKRLRPQALFLESSFILGFLLWAILFGFYRYVAPLEMSAMAVVIASVLLHWPGERTRAGAAGRFRSLAQPVALLGLAAAMGVGATFSIYTRLGNPAAFGTSYFGVPAGTFTAMAGDGVVLAGSPVGYLVPRIPASSEIVSVGGSAELVMSKSWWAHVRSDVQAAHKRWWLVASGLSEPATLRYVRQIGFPPSLGACLNVYTAVTTVVICRLAQPT